ncbi:TetR/AcrR family transcriptional regulator [Streptomyces sp. NPDC047072]|uniref:TetR/AcrR family transcriptional regulator n=1 Tax=Streptomyces sp. NPDC047072 TaxID=3154809 RepID=UPI0033C09032
MHRPVRRARKHLVRYGNEHKQATRQRIIEAAGRRFKRDGIDGSGVSTLMKDAGLTNGAFYTHFASKDELVATAVTDQLQTQNASVATQVAPGRAGIEQIVRWYLSPTHRDTRDEGCPSAALLDEIGRCPDATRQAYTEGVLTVADGIAARLAPDDPLSVRTMTLTAYAMMAGTLQLSRALTDRQLADRVLDQGVQNALALLGVAEPGCAATAS